MQGRRNRQLPDRCGDPQISKTGLRSLRRSDPQCAGRGGAAPALFPRRQSPARSWKRDSACGRPSSPQPAQLRSAACSGSRPASRICRSPDRPGPCRCRLPCIRENAVLRDDGRDVRRADAAESLAGGDEQVRRDARAETRIAARAGMRGRRLRDCLCPVGVAREGCVDVTSVTGSPDERASRSGGRGFYHAITQARRLARSD